MAESVIIPAASSVISSAVNSIATLARDEIKFLGDVPAKVQSIEAKLRAIQSYLKDAENKPQKSHLTANWLHEIKGVTYRAQDVIEKIIWLQRRRNRARGCARAFSRYNILGYLKRLHEIGAEIDRINSFLPEIVDITNNLNVVDLAESSSMTNEFDDPRTAIHFGEEDEVVGFDKEITEIIKELLDPVYKPLSVVSLVGMGGIGKTTLAKKVSKHSDVKKHFDIIASITVSKEYNVLNLQKEILKASTQIKNEDLEKMTQGEVRDKLYGYLKEKKYLLLVDDIWTVKSWDEINPHNTTFPNISNGSRIILTTRNLEVARHPGVRSFVHEIKLLDDDKSWELLKKRAFPPYAMVSDPTRNELENLGPRLVRKCNGLPLALVVLGGYLSKHFDYQTWSRMAEAVDWNEAGNQINISKILALSYHDLPNILKPIFLYITTFPEDHVIESSNFIRLWIAEGFIPPGQKYKLEIMARIYLDQLNGRGLVQVVERSETHGWISKIRIHDVLRDWGIERAKEEGFFHVIKDSDVVISDVQIPYRVALHGYCDENIATSMPNLRTMLGFEQPTQNVSFHGMNSLHVVSLMQKEGTNKFPKFIKHMIFLRYICLQCCSSVYFPSSIGDLGNLQTLDCRDSEIFSLPCSLWGISTLRHIWLDRICCNWNGPKKGSGKNLQTLVILDDGGLLRACMTWMYTGMDGVAVTIEEMEHMAELRLDSGLLPRNLLSKISGLRYLEVLVLDGPIKGLTRIPAANAFPPNILKLKLCCNEFVEDPMPVLEELPKLVKLHLEGGLQLKSMRCSANGFPRLKYLKLSFFSVLEDWKVGVGAMPSLCDLRIFGCHNLKKFPEELMEHDQLQHVILDFEPHLSNVDYSKLEGKGCEVIIDEWRHL